MKTEVKMTDMCNVDLNKEKSSMLFHILMAMGYSQEEILVRRQLGKWWNTLFRFELNILPISPESGCSVLTGSRCEGLEGNYKITDNIGDRDFILVYNKHKVRDGNEICDVEYSSVSSDFIYLDKNTINNPETFMEDVKSYPGYVKLFQISKNKKQYYVYDSDSLSGLVGVKYDSQNKKFNGPAVTFPGYQNRSCSSLDMVNCRVLEGWPAVAKEFLSRKRPYDWPTKETIHYIKSEGCFIAPVGHFDSNNKNREWRISVRGEVYLFSQLNHIQLLCYVILKWILKLEIKKVSMDSISSFHIKNLIFWCAENFSCKWTSSNLLFCIRKCIKKLRTCVLERKLSHYCIVKRNLFNSKLTRGISTDVEQILLRYENNIMSIFKHDIFEYVRIRDIYKPLKQNTHYDYLKRETLISVILSCVNITLFNSGKSNTHMTPILQSFYCNVSKRLKKFQETFDYLSNNNTIFTLPVIRQLKFAIGVLNFFAFEKTGDAKYLDKESSNVEFYWTNKAQFPYLLLRQATSMYMKQKYGDVISLCLQPINDDVKTQMDQMIFNIKTNIRIEKLALALHIDDLFTVKKHVLAGFYCADKLEKPLPLSSSIAREIIARFKNLPSYNDSYPGVGFYEWERSIVPDVLMFEFFTDRHTIKEEYVEFILSAKLCKLLLLFLSYMKMNMVTEADVIIKSMGFYIDERHFKEIEKHRGEFETFYSQIRNSKDLYDQNIVFHDSYEFVSIFKEIQDFPDDPRILTEYFIEKLFRAYNIVAYCNIKVHRYEQAARYILKSIDIYPSRKNAAFGYLRIIIFILRQIM